MSKIDEYLELVPESIRPVLASYGDFLLGLGLEEVVNLIDLFINGKSKEAHKIVMSRMESDALVGGAGLLEQWKELSEKTMANKEILAELTGNLLRSLLVAVLIHSNIPVSVWPVGLRKSSESKNLNPEPPVDPREMPDPVDPGESEGSDGSEITDPTGSGDGS